MQRRGRRYERRHIGDISRYRSRNERTGEQFDTIATREQRRVFLSETELSAIASGVVIEVRSALNRLSADIPLDGIELITAVEIGITDSEHIVPALRDDGRSVLHRERERNRETELRLGVLEQEHTFVHIRIKRRVDGDRNLVMALLLLLNYRCDRREQRVREGIGITEASSTRDVIRQREHRITFTKHVRGDRSSLQRLVDLEIEHPRDTAVKRRRDGINHRGSAYRIHTSVTGVRQILRKEHRVFEDTQRFHELEHNDTIAGCNRVSQHHGVGRIGVINRIGSLIPYITGLTILITEHYSTCLVCRAERFQMEIKAHDGVTRTTSGTQLDDKITTLNRYIERRRNLVRPVLITAFALFLNRPLVRLNMIVLTYDGIGFDVINLLYPGFGSVQFDLINILAAVAHDLRPCHD